MLTKAGAAHLDGNTGSRLQQNVHRLLSGGIVEDSVVKGRVAQAVTHRQAGASFQQDLHDIAELGRLGGGFREQGGSVHVLDIKLDVGVITEEGLEEICVPQSTDFLQFLLYWTKLGVDDLEIQTSLSFSPPPYSFLYLRDNFRYCGVSRAEIHVIAVIIISQVVNQDNFGKLVILVVALVTFYFPVDNPRPPARSCSSHFGLTKITC